MATINEQEQQSRSAVAQISFSSITMVELSSLVAWTLLAVAVLALLAYAVAKAVEYRNPPIGKFIEIDGARLHYFEPGRGLPVVFLHGNATMLPGLFLPRPARQSPPDDRRCRAHGAALGACETAAIVSRAP
jgi:hypothetical protein